MIQNIIAEIIRKERESTNRKSDGTTEDLLEDVPKKYSGALACGMAYALNSKDDYWDVCQFLGF